MDKTLIALKTELKKATDDIVKRWLYNSIQCLMKAIEQQKMILKKSERKLKQEAKIKVDAINEALREIEKNRRRIK